MPELSPKVLARAMRMEEKHATRRNLIVAAAKAEFAISGLGGTTMRGIAAAAGVTTGAIYPHFATKDELYSAVLEETLSDLDTYVADALTSASDRCRGTRALTAFFEFYASRPDDLALGLYLYDGIGRSGLNPELNAHLNRLLLDVLNRITEAYQADGQPDAAILTANGVSRAVGLLVMERTGRLKLIGMSAAELFHARNG